MEKLLLKDVDYLHYLNLLPELGPKRLWDLNRFFGSFEVAAKSMPRELLAAGLPPEITSVVAEHCRVQELDQRVWEEMKAVRQLDIVVVKFEDKRYPPLLREISTPPVLLYCRGNLDCLTQQVWVAVVGTRRPTNYGLTATKKLVEGLVAGGIAVVSGLAFGIDTAAHQTALANDGLTVAVLPGGVDKMSVYPQSRTKLAEAIAETGCLISECPPKSPTLPYTFLARNRIIAGLCGGVVVVECANRSGALMTARYARDENRSVYAVPGSIFNLMSAGTNALLGQGAIPVSSAEDIFSDLGFSSVVDIQKTENLTTKEKLVLQYINSTPTAVDNIVKSVGRDGQLGEVETISLLAALELKGVIFPSGAGEYSLGGH